MIQNPDKINQYLQKKGAIVPVTPTDIEHSQPREAPAIQKSVELPQIYPDTQVQRFPRHRSREMRITHIHRFEGARKASFFGSTDGATMLFHSVCILALMALVMIVAAIAVDIRVQYRHHHQNTIPEATKRVGNEFI